ncbi:hypothetical protein EYC80_009108 [Monilinia laxa]|uniref:Amidohydrolase-related domain-containing protein n=1 Tax=Monilinia laxa TaxID=61186 RepID=A0A5N6K2S9_MONLA|nr:hypothetical protein EYC80_009108 [Monilinia laxa]
MSSSTPIVDIHTHIYPPSYIELLKSRNEIPYIRQFPPAKEHRLVILPAEDTPSTSRGRPIGPEYYDISQRIAFMNTHSIRTSIISLANPWLDWLPHTTATATALTLNTEINDLCALHPTRLYFFGSLPLSVPASSILTSIAHLQTLPYCRGVILGTTGLGSGLDDPSLLPIFTALLHRPPPHIPTSTLRAPRLRLRPTSLRIRPRVTPCPGLPPRNNHIHHADDPRGGLRRRARTPGPPCAQRGYAAVSRRQNRELYLARWTFEGGGEVDGGQENHMGDLEEECLVGCCGLWGGGGQGGGGEGGREEGGKGKKWLSVQLNIDAISKACGAGSEEEKAILGGNAIRLFGLDLSAEETSA